MKPQLAVERMSNAQLFDRLDRDTRELQAWLDGGHAYRKARVVISEIRIIHYELKLRGIQQRLL